MTAFHLSVYYPAELATCGGFSPFGALRHHLCHGVKRVTRFSGRCAPLRIVFPCHPAVRGHNKAPQSIFLMGCSILSTGYCPTALAGGRWWRQPPKEGRRKGTGPLTHCHNAPLPIYLLSSIVYRLSSNLPSPIQKTPLINERRFLIVRGRQPCEGGGFSFHQCLRFRCSPPGRSGGRGCRGSRRCCGFRGFSLRVYPVLFP